MVNVKETCALVLHVSLWFERKAECNKWRSWFSFIICYSCGSKERIEIRYVSKSHCWNPKVWNPLEETLKRERIRQKVMEDMPLIQMFNAEKGKYLIEHASRGLIFRKQWMYAYHALCLWTPYINWVELLSESIRISHSLIHGATEYRNMGEQCECYGHRMQLLITGIISYQTI